MVRRTHNGRPGYHWLVPDWAKRFRKAANRLLTDECEIRAPSTTGVFDPVTGTYVTTPGALRYRGPCSVQRLPAQELQGVVTEQAMPSQGYRVAVDREVDNVQVRDLVTFTRSSDGRLTGQSFPVKSIVMGGPRFVRDLIVTDDLTT